MKVGQLFDDRYELVEILGAGGTGSVWRATDSVLDREVAVKVLRAGGPDDEIMRARLRTEAQIAGSLVHPGIGAVHDYGETDEAPYIVMAVVPGQPLSQVLRRERVLDPQRVMSVVAQVATALEAAHQVGIIHRDLKPGNVMVDDDDRAVLVDFGIARSDDHEPLTMTGTMVGTVDYVSPEQVAGGSATVRSDLYSLGMLAYESLTGLKPFRRESQVATALAHLNDEAPPLPAEMPEGVRVLVERLMAKDPAHRPPSAALVAALAAAAVRSPDEVTESLPTLPPVSRPRPVRESRGAGRRTVLVLAMATVLAAMAFLGSQVVGQTDDTAATADTVELQALVDVVGLRANKAARRLEAEGLVVERVKANDADAPRGEVVRQLPAAGTEVEEGSVVELRIASTPPEPTATPTTVVPSTTTVPSPSPTTSVGGGGGTTTGKGSTGTGPGKSRTGSATSEPGKSKAATSKPGKSKPATSKPGKAVKSGGRKGSGPPTKAKGRGKGRKK